MIGMQTCPCVDGAGNGDGGGRLTRDFGQSALFEPVDRQSLWCAAGAVVGDDLSLAARCIEGETVTADACGSGLDHALDGTGGDGRVHRVSARLQNVDRRQCRVRV